MACALGDDEVVGLLLNAGADKDAADDDGTTGLIAASRAGHFLAVRVLQQGGVDVDLANNDGITGLIAASRAGHVGVVGNSAGRRRRQGCGRKRRHHSFNCGIRGRPCLRRESAANGRR